MRAYETVIVLDAGLEEEPLEQEVSTIEQLIASQNGEMVDTERWGNRKLSYEISDKQQGYYTLFRFNGEPEVIDELDRVFKLNDHIIRHMIKRVKKHPESSRPEAAETAETAEAKTE